MSEDLLRRLARRDHSAAGELEALVERAATAYRADLGLDFEDTARSATLEILRDLERRNWQGIDDLRAWVWRATGRTCLDVLRRNRVIRWESYESRLESHADRRVEHQPDHASREVALKVLAQASDECRELWSRILRGDSYEEMSADLGLSVGALRVRVLRCRRWAQSKRDRIS